MALDIKDLRTAREWALTYHQPWKAQIKRNDAIAADQWSVAWDDGTEDASDPLVENVYKGALEDKIHTASAAMPMIIVPPPPGTKEDEGERKAQRRRRVFQSYWDRSNMHRLLSNIYRDWFHTGAAFTIPWTEFWQADGTPTPPASRAPYLMQFDPRQVYPLAHDNRGRLVKVMVARQRRTAELKAEYGEGNPIFYELASARRAKGLDEATFLEELWIFDQTYWGVALGDSMLPREYQGRQILPVGTMDTAPTSNVDWVTQPTRHNLGYCPVAEAKRTTHDGSYRGALEDIIPALRIANDFMARLLDDLHQNIYAPVVLDNIANPDEYGPGARLIGTGDGKADIIRDRPPVNFEGNQTVTSIIAQAHRQASWPVQRSGDPDASVVSAKGVVALTGTFNAELAHSQQDVQGMLQHVNECAAAFDEHHCAGKKKIHGMEGVRAYSETYDPATLFKGDYRNKVSYGDASGQDENSRITKLAMFKNLGAISLRTFIERTNASEDPLQEERDIAIENLTKLFYEGVLPQQVQAGDYRGLKQFVDLIDSDEETVRSAVLQTIAQIQPVAGPMPGGPAGGAPPDVIQMQRSLASGGIPGNAEGQPSPPTIGDSLQRVLPPRQRRLVSENGPGNTAA